MGNGGNVLDKGYLKPCVCQCSNRGFAARSGTVHINFNTLHAAVDGNFRRVLGNYLGRKRRAPLGTAQRHLARAGPGNRVALGVGYGYYRVIKGSVNMRTAFLNTALYGATLFLPPKRSFLLLPFLTSLLLLTAYGLLGTFAGTCVLLGGLAAYGQTLAVPYAPVATYFRQSLDVQLDFTM